MVASNNCLNCENIITDKFCPTCGQRTTVHRYSLKHFVEHDLIHGIWHVDNGALYTIKDLFTRPGHGVREFINGKRVRYFSFITLLLLILGISHFLGEYAQIKMSDLMPESSKGAINDLEEFAKKYPKSMLLITIPFYSIFSFFWFRKSNLNLTEHFVLNSYKTVGESLIGLLFLVITIFFNNIQVLTFIYSFISLSSLIYAFWFYRQFFSVFGYSKKALILRSIGVIFSYLFLSMLVGVIMAIIKHSK